MDQFFEAVGVGACFAATTAVGAYLLRRVVLYLVGGLPSQILKRRVNDLSERLDAIESSKPRKRP